MSERERIVAAAIKVGEIVCMVEPPGRHHNAFYAMSRAGFDQRIGPEQQGFITSMGRFVDRVVGLMIAVRADQIKDQKEGNPNELYSEDMW